MSKCINNPITVIYCCNKNKSGAGEKGIDLQGLQSFDMHELELRKEIN